MFEFFTLGSKAYNRRAETMLREARFAQLEHEAAAEHHNALARMYAERVTRLQDRNSEHSEHSEHSKVTQSEKVPLPAAPMVDAPRSERAPFRVLTQTPTATQGAV